MISMPSIYNFRAYYCMFIILLTISSAVSQTPSQEKMGALSFMVGDWIGISTTYKNDTIVKQVPAYQKINYRLDKNVITIDLQSETLQLHTVIHYDNKDNTYYYNSFYKGGTGKYPAEFMNDKLIVSPNKNKRFIFNLNSEGNFQEYGEKFENGKWIKYFEDNFTKSP